MRSAVQVRQSEVRRLERSKIAVQFFSSRSEIPNSILLIRHERLLDQSGKLAQVEPRGRSFLCDEFSRARFRQREAELVAANSLRLDDESRRPREIACRYPQVA